MKLLYNDTKYNFLNSLFEAEDDNTLIQAIDNFSKNGWKDFEQSELYKFMKENGAKLTDSSNDVDSSANIDASAVQFISLSQDSQQIIDSNNKAIDAFSAGMKSISLKENLNFQYVKALNEDAVDFSKFTDDDFADLVAYIKEIEEDNKKNDNPPINNVNANNITIEKEVKQNTDPVDDPIYKTALVIIDKDGSASKKLRNAILKIAKDHDAILNMYNTTLFEDDWDDDVVYKFNDLLDDYNSNLSIVKNELTTTQWNYKYYKDKFFEIYKEVIKGDNYVFNRLRVRHNNYKRYRSNRKSLVAKIASFLTLPKLSNGNNSQKVFNFLNDQCDSIPLYDNKNQYGEPTSTIHESVLRKYLKDNYEELTNKLNTTPIYAGQHSYSYEDVTKISPIYVHCREMAYAIFNMCTSLKKYNGWNKFQNIFPAYCNDELTNKAMRHLYDSALNNSSMDTADDYFQQIDQQNFNREGIYESKQLNETWWDDDVKWYKENQKDRFTKDAIKKIEMIPTNINVCKVCFDGKYVYAQVDFYPNDIIEVCPTRKIDKSSLYSSDMRGIAFEVVHNSEWVVPFGYCQYYCPAGTSEGNCDYLWDPNSRTIIIRANKQIKKNEKLILQISKI